MRRIGIVATLSMALLALSVGIADARPATSFGARANTAPQGGQLMVKAKVRHATKGATFSASAVVHLASGDVAVTLKRAGKSFVAKVKVPVAAGEALGPVMVDVTITYNGVDEVVTTEGQIVLADDEGASEED